ncbi:MAG: hypothetical protein K6F09_07465 [Clostridiales bacterium]|nr:hypothetical protein [Clostridiales bacterium]
MTDISREQLVELITREVMRIAGNSAETEEKDKSGFPDVLVIGSADKLPVHIRNKYNLHGIECYKCEADIEKFEKIYITELNLTELADIALGRNTRAVQCAVISGLLCGKEIFLLDCALTFRKLSTVASRGFYQLLEGYVRTLQSFGIKLVNGQTPIDKYTVHSAPGDDLPEGIITEALAQDMVKKSNSSIIIVRKGTVITPSAKDVFLHASKTIETV